MGFNSFRQRMRFLQPTIPPRGFYIFPWKTPADFVLLQKIRVCRPIIENKSAARL
jgi:hypothetical protein